MRDTEEGCQSRGMRQGYKEKIFRGEIKGVDVEAGTVTAVVSTEAPDRDGDIIRVAGWDLGNFNKHPVLLADHNYGDVRAQIGEWTEMKVVKGQNPRVEGTARYYINEGNDKADWAFALAQKGKAAFSVGFIPDMDKAEAIGDDGSKFFGPFEFRGQELLEVSQVTIPAHPDALQRMKGLVTDPVVAQVVDEVLGESPGEPDVRQLIESVEDRLNQRLNAIEALLRDATNLTPKMTDDDPGLIFTNETPSIIRTPEWTFRFITEGVDEAISGRQ